MLNEWLRQPLLDQRLINERLDLVELLLSSLAYVTRKDLKNYLSLFPDLLRAVKRLERGSSSLQEIVRLHQVVKSLSKVVYFLSSLSNIKSTELKSGIEIIRSQFLYPLQATQVQISYLFRKL